MYPNRLDYEGLLCRSGTQDTLIPSKHTDALVVGASPASMRSSSFSHSCTGTGAPPLPPRRAEVAPSGILGSSAPPFPPSSVDPVEFTAAGSCECPALALSQWTWRADHPSLWRGPKENWLTSPSSSSAFLRGMSSSLSCTSLSVGSLWFSLPSWSITSWAAHVVPSALCCVPSAGILSFLACVFRCVCVLVSFVLLHTTCHFIHVAQMRACGAQVH